MIRRRAIYGSALAALVCAGGAGCDDDEESSPSAEAPMQSLFSFALIADPHISGELEREQRLSAVVSWINAQRSAEQIEFVVVLGDIGWGNGLARSKELLDEFELPYVPVIGDNEIHGGDEQAFAELFQPQYAVLATEFDQWRKAVTPVTDPTTADSLWLQNMAFEYRGLRLFGLDWCSRSDDLIAGETGDPHDFDGGSLPWLQQEFAIDASTPRQSVLLFSHIPMVVGMFTSAQVDAFGELFLPYQQQVYANFAGHLHSDWEQPVEQAGYVAYGTDATHDDDNRVRLVRVAGNGVAFSYDHELVTVP